MIPHRHGTTGASRPTTLHRLSPVSRSTHVHHHRPLPTRNTVYVAVFAAMIAAMGLVPPITLGVIPVPITLQTLGVMLAGAMLGPWRGSLASLVVIVLSVAGLPLLAGGRGGLGVLLGPNLQDPARYQEGF